jgi:hypothetical protein
VVLTLRRIRHQANPHGQHRASCLAPCAACQLKKDQHKISTLNNLLHADAYLYRPMRRADSSGVSVFRGGATARELPDLSATGEGGRPPLPGLRLPCWALMLLLPAGSGRTRSGLGRLVLP